jgi:hypothetical protein
VENDRNSTDPESGFLTVTADDVIVFEAGFLLDPGQNERFSFDWTAPNTATTVAWEASVVLDSGNHVAPVTDSTLVRASQPNRP